MSKTVTCWCGLQRPVFICSQLPPKLVQLYVWLFFLVRRENLKGQSTEGSSFNLLKVSTLLQQKVKSLYWENVHPTPERQFVLIRYGGLMVILASYQVLQSTYLDYLIIPKASLFLNLELESKDCWIVCFRDLLQESHLFISHPSTFYLFFPPDQPKFVI